MILRKPIICPHGQARVFFQFSPSMRPTNNLQKESKSRRVRIRQRTNTQSHRFFTISFSLLPYTIVSFGGLPNNKSKSGGLIMQGFQTNRANLNRNLLRELVRRFFHWYFCLRTRVELYKLSHEKVQKRELMPKKAEKLKFLMRFVEIFNTPRFERNFRETILEKNWFKSIFLLKTKH